MTLTSVEEAIARIPRWRDATDLKVSFLSGGITNRNYRVDVGGASFVLRLSGEKTELLGIDREHECRAQHTAAEAGLAPEVIDFLRPEGYLITRFIEGRSIPPEELRQPARLQHVAELLRRMHGMPEIPGTFNSFQVVRDYMQVARDHQIAFPQNFDGLLQCMNEAEAALGASAFPLRPCHNDLLNANFLLGDRLYILDWEYAGMGDVFFDLANFSSNHELSADEEGLLLDGYFGEVHPQHIAHLNIMKVMSDFREAMWGLVQLGISTLDFDFRDYAEKHFQRLTQKLQDPRWEQWLADVG
jgi:thiamine kinase-like enzyme